MTVFYIILALVVFTVLFWGLQLKTPDERRWVRENLEFHIIGYVVCLLFYGWFLFNIVLALRNAIHEG